MMMRLWVVFVVMVVSVFAQDSVTNHNGAQHKALCDVLTIAAHKWEKARETLSNPLKKALAKTLFGREDGELSELKDLPRGYDDVGGSRGLWCGQPKYDASYQSRWSGHSATHDMVCLCTAGENGWPVNSSSPRGTTLCGKDKTALKAEEDKGWGGSGNDGKEQIGSTWTNVTVPCLEGGGAGDLKQALNDFLRKLENKSTEDYTNRYQLGEGTPVSYTACTGTTPRGVCVMYCNNTRITKTMPWWTDLQNAIKEDEEIQKRREEEEKRRQQEKVNDNDQPTAERLSATPMTTNQTHQSQKDNITDKLHKHNLTGSSSIILPPSWLLSVVFLI
ncbi:Variant surface glycoprotein [Trypanosoma congolense IL3000]|uniref:Variant surface glycoprotein n=1 Tax=Trypanosoma congolense (strain IL3000) TaxID=1068625 RepID=F9WDE2_TRYCI|nr:Variant surface glycoprotein [Trypanosoma congolense IL3000]